MGDREIIDAFHVLFHRRMFDTWANTRWLGVALEKPPGDLWVYQEIIAELRPDLIIETGTRFGGSALYMASLCDLLGTGHVVTVDVEDMASNEHVRPAHPRITYIVGSSTSAATLEQIRGLASSATRVMVILDSDHSLVHVVDELRLYWELVTPGSYLIVEDTQFNGHPILPEHGPGPMEAVELFLKETDEFVADITREKFLVTFHPRGYLKRVGTDSAAGRALLAEERCRAAVDEAQAARERLAAREHELQQCLSEAKVELAEAQVELARRTNEVIDYRAKLDSVLNSTSWRMTAPLRRKGS
jgi:cephalosporin hydroxylase